MINLFFILLITICLADVNGGGKVRIVGIIQPLIINKYNVYI
jgi:hypothetical protein